MTHLVPSRAPHITAQADDALARIDILNNPYFKALQEGSMSLEAFRSSQEQFFYAVTFFPRPMAALVGRIVDPKLRLDILRNLVEEHGEFDEQAFHHNTFQRFLETIGSDVNQLEEAALAAPLRAFNSVLSASCAMDELEVGVACMGIIEYAFAPISTIIGQATVARGWIQEDQLVHYKLHAEIDHRHAEEFFAVIEPLWGNPARRYFIEQGLNLGAYIFNRLFLDLYTLGLAPISKQGS